MGCQFAGIGSETFSLVFLSLVILLHRGQTFISKNQEIIRRNRIRYVNVTKVRHAKGGTAFARFVKSWHRRVATLLGIRLLAIGVAVGLRKHLDHDCTCGIANHGSLLSRGRGQEPKHQRYRLRQQSRSLHAGR